MQFLLKWLDKLGFEKKHDTYVNILTVNKNVVWTQNEAIALLEFYNTDLGKKFLAKIEAGVHDMHGWACSYAPAKSYEHAMGTANGYKTLYAHILQLAKVHKPEEDSENSGTESLLERLKT